MKFIPSNLSTLSVVAIHNKPFFAFTLVRDPIPHAISYFKMFHVDCRDAWCEQNQFNATQDGLLMSIVPNRQCFMLKHISSIAGMHPSFYRDCTVSDDDCRELYRIMTHSLDWIGTTESLSQETIPLLSYMLSDEVPGEIDVENVKNKKIANRSLFENELNDTAMTRLRLAMTQDQLIYNQVKQSYSIKKLYNLSFSENASTAQYVEAHSE